jgi:hypothetical protein
MQFKNQVSANETWAIGNKRYNATPVLLPPISDEMQTDEQLEPQFIRKRHGNLSYVTLDSTNNNYTIPNNAQFFLSGNFFARKIQRFSLVSIDFYFYTPNINPNNNILKFVSSVTGLTYSVTLPEGFYNTQDALFTMIVAAMNTVTGSSGLTFSFVDTTDGTPRVILTATGGTYQFVSSSFMLYGQNVVNLPMNDSPSASKTLGPIQLLYTRYIDIISLGLTQYTKNPNTSNSLASANLFFRLPIISSNPGLIAFSIPNPTMWINYNRSSDLQAIDLQLIDENGFPLYIPSYANNFYFLFTLLTEL